MIAFAGRCKDEMPGQEAYRENRQQKNKACRELSEITSVVLSCAGTWSFFKGRKIFFQSSLLLTSAGGKRLENSIHHVEDSNVTSMICFEQQLLVLLLPVGCCMKSGQLSWFMLTIFTEEHVPSLRCACVCVCESVSGKILQETFDLFIIHILKGTVGSPAFVLSSYSVCVISLRWKRFS